MIKRQSYRKEEEADKIPLDSDRFQKSQICQISNPSILSEANNLEQQLSDAHDNILPTNQAIIVFLGLAFTLLFSYIDQTGITVALPYIADTLHAQKTISWAGTSTLIGNTVVMGAVGRLSDIFGRKYVLIGCVLLLGFGELACGFAQTNYQVFIFRGFCGFGAGGINGSVLVIVSDIVTLETRGKYLGILGVFVGLGSSVGPFFASLFIEYLTWREFYYSLSPIVISSSVLIWKFVPATDQKCNFKDKVCQIDYFGILTYSFGIILILIPISGTRIDKNEALVILFTVIGSLLLISFLFIEKYFANLPVIPLNLFSTTVSLTVLLTQNFFFGIPYYSLLFFIPFYFETVRGLTIIHTSLFILSITITQITFSILAGQIISRVKHYFFVLWFGYLMWMIGVGLFLSFSLTSSDAGCIVSLCCIGIAAGSTFQTSLVAAQAQSFRKDRATAISTSILLRTLGGAIGLAVSTKILADNYLTELAIRGPQHFTRPEIEHLSRRIISSSRTLKDYSTIQIEFLRGIYMNSLKNVFYLWLGCIGYCLIVNVLVKDNGIEPLDGLKDSERPQKS